MTQFGPITGGLFLEDEVIEIGPGTPFTPDHDQRPVAAFGVNHEYASAGLSWSLTGRYESGTPLEVGTTSWMNSPGVPGRTWWTSPEAASNRAACSTSR